MLMKTTVTSSPSLAGTSGITLDSLRVSYHGNVVLKPLSLTIEPGEVLALIGPSGSGKTTVLRAIAGFVQPAGGRILIGDTDVTQLPPYKRGLAMVVQNYALFPHMKVEDNVAFGLRAQKQPRGFIAERVTEALKIVGMADYATRYPHQLSGGQQQRVAIARAIAVRPRVLLLDEPLSALDAQIRHNMVEEIARLHRELPELTILYVTHDQTEAMTMGDRICVMKLGHIMQVDTPDNLYHQPKNMFVAGFIGAPEMNIRPSQLVEHGGRLHLTLGDQRLPLNDRLQSKVETHKNQQVFFGVRPEFVSLSDEPFAEGSCAGEMVRVENMGHEFFVYLRVADYELTARVPSDDAKPMIARGLNRKVYFTFDLNKCHIFDAKTEQNLSL